MFQGCAAVALIIILCNLKKLVLPKHEEVRDTYHLKIKALANLQQNFEILASITSFLNKKSSYQKL